MKIMKQLEAFKHAWTLPADASGMGLKMVEEFLFEVNWCFGFGLMCPCRAAFFRSRKNQWRV